MPAQNGLVQAFLESARDGATTFVTKTINVIQSQVVKVVGVVVIVPVVTQGMIMEAVVWEDGIIVPKMAFAMSAVILQHGLLVNHLRVNQLVPLKGENVEPGVELIPLVETLPHQDAVACAGVGLTVVAVAIPRVHAKQIIPVPNFSNHSIGQRSFELPKQPYLFIGIRIQRQKEELILCQFLYIRKILILDLVVMVVFLIKKISILISPAMLMLPALSREVSTL